MIRKTLAALLLAGLPAMHASAGTVDFGDRAGLRGLQGLATDGYAAYVGDRWTPITIHLEQTPMASSPLAGLAAPQHVLSGSALYNWTQPHSAGGGVSSGDRFSFGWGWGSGRHGYLADDDGDDYGVPKWHGHGPWHGHGHGGGSDDGGGVPAVPLPAAFPLLLSALALLGFALRSAGRD
jgi:hypothetical protein